MNEYEYSQIKVGDMVETSDGKTLKVIEVTARSVRCEDWPGIASYPNAYVWKVGEPPKPKVQTVYDKLADLRQRLEDTEALLIIARATETAMQDELAAKDAEIKRLRGAAKQAMDFIDHLGENSPIVFGGEAIIYHALRDALGYEQAGE